MKRILVATLLASAVIFCGAGCLNLLEKDDQSPSQQSSSDAPRQGRSGANSADSASSRDAGVNSLPASKGAAPDEFAGTGVETDRSLEGFGDTPQEQQTQPRQPAQTAGNELLPQSNDRKLSRSDLAGLSNWQLTLARNEIYARHGRPFSNAAIRAYFMGTGWYAADSSFSETWLSAVEQQNAAFVRDYQAGAFGTPATGPNGGGATQQTQPSTSSELLPQSNDRRLSRNDLAGLSNWQLTLARNEIYARHGRPFSNPAIRAYFKGKSWYSPNSSFSESWLSSVEQQNAAFVRDYQAGAFGSPATSPSGGGSPRSQQPPTTSGELLPQSNDRKLSASDLSGMSNWRLTLARNEIYARHGRPFSNSRIRAHFQATGWYTPKSGFSESWLSGTERRNADFIREYQERTYGAPATRP